MNSETPLSAHHVPPGAAHHDWLTTTDGERLFLRDWPLARAEGAVLLVHGLGEHSGRYTRLAAWFNRHGYAVRGYDQRGHGHSTGQRGALRHADDLLTDLATVYLAYSHELSARPLLLGHSMGGLVALRCVLDGRFAPPALVLSSPALRSREPLWKVRLARLLSRLAPRLPLRNQLPSAMASHDAQVVAAYRTDPLRSGWITPRLADFIFRAGAACIADAPLLGQPTLLLAAESDVLVDSSGSREFAIGAAPTGQLTSHFFPLLYHELFNEAEPWREQVLLQLDQWLRKTTEVRRD